MNRLFKTHAPKKSAISKTSERECERQVKKLEQLDDNCRKLYKDMKRCTDVQTAMVKQEVKMTQDLLDSTLCREDDELRALTEQWNQAALQMERHIQELTATSQRTVTEPMKKYSGFFPGVQAAVKKRESCLQEYSKWQVKVDKYQDRDRTGPNIVKLDANRKSLAGAREEYEHQHATVMEDMPRLYEGRLEYFRPSFQALIKAQVKQYTESHKLYSELVSGLACTEHTDSAHSNSVQQKLDRIRALEITVDN